MQPCQLRCYQNGRGFASTGSCWRRQSITGKLRRMTYILVGAVLLGVLYGLTKLASGDRYAKMTEEEFEKEAQRSSSMGAAMSAVQKVFDPSHHIEYVEEQKQRVEAEDSESGDRPSPGPRAPEGHPPAR
jgi:hypothetical protein